MRKVRRVIEDTWVAESEPGKPEPEVLLRRTQNGEYYLARSLYSGTPYTLDYLSLLAEAIGQAIRGPEQLVPDDYPICFDDQEQDQEAISA